MDPFSSFLFNLPPLATICIIAFAITLFTSLVYKFVTDQKLMKTLKDELKELQNLMKQHKDKPEKLLEIQQKAMEKNMEYMKHSMRPTFFTMIPLILVFGWLNAHIAYYPIMPNSNFDVMAEFAPGTVGNVTLNIFPENPEFVITGNNPQSIENNAVRWTIKGPEGKYKLQYSLNNSKMQEQDLLITNERTYARPDVFIKDKQFKKLHIDNKLVMPLDFIGLKWGWIWAYIIISILFSMIVRKTLNIN